MFYNILLRECQVIHYINVYIILSILASSTIYNFFMIKTFKISSCIFETQYSQSLVILLSNRTQYFFLLTGIQYLLLNFSQPPFLSYSGLTSVLLLTFMISTINFSDSICTSKHVYFSVPGLYYVMQCSPVSFILPQMTELSMA